MEYVNGSSLEDVLACFPNGLPLEADASVTVDSGSLESSNVNLASCMVNMIELSRHFDLQVKALHTAEEDGQASSKLLQSSSG